MTRLALIGVGKIARDQHVPAIAANDAFDLVATASPHGRLEGVRGFSDLATLLASGIAVDAVALCTPPGIRHAVAMEAIDAGLHVMLEKPPAATLTEAADLTARASDKGVTLQATWHSRHAAGVAPARDWLADKIVTGASIAWREDIRRWHPGQEWILAAGGFGVFDPGINALSILTEIMPERVVLTGAQLGVPEGRISPLTAELTMRSGTAPIAASFDFLQTGPQTWSMTVETTDGQVRLEDGGQALFIGDERREAHDEGEYPSLYRRFAELIAGGASDVDLAPLRLVADAFLIGDRTMLEPFAF